MSAVDRLTAGPPLLHVDWLDYAAALLEANQVDWQSGADVAGLLGRAQGLIASDLVLVPVDRFLAARLRQDMALRAVVSAKTRNVQPLRALLADEGIRQDIVALIADVRAQVREGMLGMLLPSPAALVALAATECGLAVPDIDEDLVDDAAVLVADFIRSWSVSPIDMVVLDAVEPAHAALHGPIARVAEHFGWAFGKRVDGEVQSHDGSWGALATMRIAPGANPEATLAEVEARRKAL